MYQVLASGAIPVYLGASTVHDQLPHPDAIIDASSFASPQELTAYIKKLSTDFNAFKRHMAWEVQDAARMLSERDCGDLDPWYCQMCERFAYLRASKTQASAPQPRGGNKHRASTAEQAER